VYCFKAPNARLLKQKILRKLSLHDRVEEFDLLSVMLNIEELSTCSQSRMLEWN
jgi:hypothetical protein